MANQEQSYAAAEIITAARDLQDAAGSPEKPIEVSSEHSYTLEQAINLLSAEIRILRERGFSDERVADLFTSFDIQATAKDIGAFYQPSDDASE